MLTPQEVSTRAFTKSMMGGYNMSMVDEFLDELTDDYTALYKENAALKGKMKVLVEKVEDYRATEDSMRATLLTAQKMADSIVREAEAKRDQILSQAEKDAAVKVEEMQKELRQAEERLRQGQLELARFIQSSRELCSKELQFLDALPELPVDPAEDAAPVKEQAAEEIEERVMASFHQQPENPAPEAAPQAQSEPAAEESAYPEGDPFAAPDPVLDEPTRKIDLGELKFGRNYTAERN